MKEVVLLSIPIDQFETLIINSVNLCLDVREKKKASQVQKEKKPKIEAEVENHPCEMGEKMQVNL